MHRILFITLEFSAATFSGNGVYAQSQVRSLSQQPATHVLVLSAKPHGYAGGSQTWGAQLIEVDVSQWGSLDSSAPWEEFAAKVASDDIKRQVKDFNPSICLFVDWSGLPAWQSVKLSLARRIPAVYLNYRVFTRTEAGEGKKLVQRLEADAMEQSAMSVVLSASDRDYLLQHVARQATTPGLPCCPALPPCKVLLCALRAELSCLPTPTDVSGLVDLPTADRAVDMPPWRSNSLAQAAASIEACKGQQPLPPLTAQSPAAGGAEVQPAQQAAQALQFCAGRAYLTCCVRLAKEKEPERFVALVEQLAGSLERLQLTPLLVGATNDAYAQDIKQRLRQAAPSSVIIERFMGPQELAETVFSKTRLNIHPCTYDAFGMTIVEAASMGAPSIVHSHPGAIGAADLLQASNDEIILADVAGDPAALAADVLSVLEAGERLLHVAWRAARRARSWTEDTNAQALLEIVKHATG